jgi:hypothetical protein
MMAAPFYLSIVELAGHSFDWWWWEIEMDGLSVWLKAIRCARISLSLTSTLPLAPTMYPFSGELLPNSIVVRGNDGPAGWQATLTPSSRYHGSLQHGDPN